MFCIKIYGLASKKKNNRLHIHNIQSKMAANMADASAKRKKNIKIYLLHYQSIWGHTSFLHLT